MARIDPAAYAPLNPKAGEWLEKQLAWANTRRIKDKAEREKARAEWKLAPFGHRVASILAVVFRGIHNAPRSIHTTGEWADDYVSVTVDRGLSTWDGCGLTQLVVAAHDACVRVHLKPASNRHLRLIFHPRMRTTDLAQGHPTIQRSVAVCRTWYGVPDHARDIESLLVGNGWRQRLILGFFGSLPNVYSSTGNRLWDGGPDTFVAPDMDGLLGAFLDYYGHPDTSDFEHDDWSEVAPGEVVGIDWCPEADALEGLESLAVVEVPERERWSPDHTHFVLATAAAWAAWAPAGLLRTSEL